MNKIIYIPENTTEPLIRVKLPGLPADVAFDDVNLSISYRIETQATFTTLVLSAGTLATWISETWIKESSGSAIYQLCLPAVAISAGKKTYLRMTYNGLTFDGTISATSSSTVGIPKAGETHLYTQGATTATTTEVTISELP